MIFATRSAILIRSATWRAATAATRFTSTRMLSVGSKSGNTPAPIERSESQAIPLGKFYEYILNEPQPIPDVKPEEPPVTAAKSAKAKSSKSADASNGKKASA
ncbi:uncharacterized protein PgNI_09295 [Pyricularia grisea]|uniref:Uncharacterized protein n=1 Tax=Pyricularia grisea TaxID=148305 RepID=A0A6P8ATW4_PYRGI|nr:uncharacterized protein PgNI_09295 [Pyricularia grisea]TLD05548.1 hypothetical protein PgNI_09295 [Pyricularia grisea]